MSVDPIQMLEDAAMVIEEAASIAAGIPAAAPYAVIIGGVAKLVDQAVRAIQSQDAAQMEQADKALSAALAGLPAQIAAEDAKIDAELK